MWFLYNEMSMEIQSLKMEVSFLEYLLEDFELNYNYPDFLPSSKLELDKEKDLNKRIEEELGIINLQKDNMRKTIYILIKRKQQLEREFEIIKAEKEQSIKEGEKLKKILNIKEKKIVELSTQIKYYTNKKGRLSEHALVKNLKILDEVLFLFQKFFCMVEKKTKKMHLLFVIKEKLASYEEVFYEENFQLDESVVDILLKVNLYLENWSSYYGKNGIVQGFPINEKKLFEVECLLKELRYICLYKEFLLYDFKLVNVLSLYEALRRKNRIPTKYNLKRLETELYHIYQKKYFCINNYFINRLYPGKLYVNLPSFLRLDYKFSLLKTYNMFNFFYIVGDIPRGVYKIGVAKNNFLRRIEEAQRTYKSYFKTDEFEKIKIIKSPNALNLETYIKRKLKQKRHPLMQSSEWFLLSEDESRYFTEELYFNDPNFSRIYKYEVEL